MNFVIDATVKKKIKLKKKIQGIRKRVNWDYFIE